MSDCSGEFTDEQLIYTIVLSVVCAVLTCCFVLWIILFSVVIHKNRKGTKGVSVRLREDRFGSQGINLVSIAQPVDSGNNKLFDSPIKTGTFSREKGREVADALQQNEEHYENMPKNELNYLNIGAVNSIEKSITFETFMEAKKSRNEIPMTQLDTTIPNPTYESSREVIDDQDGLPLVKEPLIKKSSKADATKKISMQGEEVTIVQDGVRTKEGVYDYLEKK